MLRREEFDADNDRREAKGLALRVWKELGNTSEDEEINEETTLENDDPTTADQSDEEEDEKDPLLVESGKILVDFITFESGSGNIISKASITR